MSEFFGVGYEVTIKGLDEQMQKLERFAAVAQPELTQAMHNVLFMVEAGAKQNAPVGVTGELRSGIGSQVTYAAGTDVRGKVGASAPHSAAVELGARPHFPPVANIAYWVDRKLGVQDGFEVYGIALAIARKIARVGQKKHPFLRPALEKNQARILDEFRGAAERVLKKMEVR